MKKMRFVLLVLVLLSGEWILAGCAGKAKISAAEPPVSAHESEAALPAPQAQKPKADKKVPLIVLLGDAEEVDGLGSFKRLAETDPTDENLEKLRIEYLLERLGRSSYNFVRNGEAHDSRKAVLLMRYKWVKYGSEVQTAEDFVEKIASGSRTSGSPYYMKANKRYYLVKDVLFFELDQLDQALARTQAGKAN